MELDRLGIPIGEQVRPQEQTGHHGEREVIPSIRIEILIRQEAFLAESSLKFKI